MTTAVKPRLIREIAAEITEVWPNVYFGAVPYLAAMHTLDDMDSTFHDDDAETVLIYFLSNTTYWRGPDAKRIKAELKAMLPAKYRR